MNRHGFTDSMLTIIQNSSYTRRYKVAVVLAFVLIVLLHAGVIITPVAVYELYGFEYAVVTGFVALSTIIATRNIRP